MQSKLGKYTIDYLNRDEYLVLKKEIFDTEIYYLDLPSSPAIIDAGAHIGLATLYFKKVYPNADITAIEPNPELFETLKRNVEQNDLTKVHIIDNCLAAKPGAHDFFMDNTDSKWYSTGGIHVGAWNGAQQSKKEIVGAITLSCFLTKPIDLLKLDIEGAEIKVLEESMNELHLVKNIIMEYHPTKNQKREKLDKIMRKANFNLINEEVDKSGLSLLTYTKK